MKLKSVLYVLVLLCVVLAGHIEAAPFLQGDDSSPPSEPVRLIFIHHSTGGNWLADPNDEQPYGGLGLALRDNNYFVSATNYGWGPEGIGDRTDIPNWPEWFTGPQSADYLSALYHESGQNIGDFGTWSRLEADPGGENEIVMFKSCFPNSDLEGSPSDPPLPEPNDWEYSVANAKAVYNDLLTYFQTRPDKLFIVITAPPLMASETSSAHAANARAFNNWLVAEWLKDYSYGNVAVFDYYNVLTAPDNHHYWRDGRVEHVQPDDSDVSAYPSDDSHPNTVGHGKATAEFVPLLNFFYHRWKNARAVMPDSTPTSVPEVQPTPTPAQEVPATFTPPAASARSVGVIEDWENENWWDSSEDEQGSTVDAEVDTVVAHSGAASLRIAFDIVADGWGDTGISFGEVQDWSAGSGLSLWIHAEEAGLPVVLVLVSGDAEAPTAFVATFETTEASVDGWDEVQLAWGVFELAPWDEGTGLNTLDPARVLGIALNYEPGEGTLWIDDLVLVSEMLSPPSAPTNTPQAAQPAATEAPSSSGGLCPLAAAVSVVTTLVAWLRRYQA